MDGLITMRGIRKQGDTRVVIPREVHDAIQLVEHDPRFSRGIAQALAAVEDDKSICSIGFSKDMDERPQAEIPRERLQPAEAVEPSSEDVRETVETAELEILRAILRRSRRRWEFVWNGVRIPAPVTDQRFYEDFAAHNITIAPGDVLKVRLKIRQRRMEGVGVFVNEGYEVVEVLRHIPQARQVSLPR